MTVTHESIPKINDYGHPRSHRLLNPGDFQNIFDKVDYKVSNSNLLLLTRKNNRETARLGFIFSKKNIKLAVNRNRIKRLTKEFFRVNYSHIPNLDIIVLAKKGLGDVNNELYVQELEKLFKKLVKRIENV